jgi:hypothetical protein
MFSVRNAVLVAIMQVGVIVAGILASGFWYKFATSSNMQMPFPASVLFNYGITGFTIPFAWILITLLLRGRPKLSDEIKDLAFWFGVLILIGLAVFVVYADVSPCFRIMWSLGGGDDA